ncbi:MAG TPA: glycosyltransferase [Syntrophorhabdaceae bacterium]|nr:glycosyltransferase [Syntrophorhabdaceae bacterium]
MHFVESLGAGGMENGIVNLANHFDRSRFDYMICCFGQPGAMAQRLDAVNTPLYALNYGDGFHFSSVLSLGRFLRKQRIDILHTHGWGSRCFIGLVAAKIARIPLCINGEHGQLHIEKTGRFLAQRVILPLYDDNLSVSEDLKYKIRRELRLPRLPVTVITNGVDTEKFHGKYNVDQLRATLKLEANDLAIGVIASLKWQKNQQVVLQAAHRLSSHGKRIRVIFVGDGPDRQMLAKMAADLSIDRNTVFLGIRSDVPQILSLLDIMILPSVPNSEGLSNVILEAMASGVPVIATNSLGTGDIIQEEITGMLFDPQDPAELARKIALIDGDSDLRQRVVGNAKERILKDYSLNVMVKRYEDYYLDLFNKAHRKDR